MITCSLDHTARRDTLSKWTVKTPLVVGEFFMVQSYDDHSILMIVGSIPDYVRGFVKLYWLLREKIRQARTLSLEEGKWIRV